MIKIADIEALFAQIKNGSVILNDVPVSCIYEIAGYFKTEVRILNSITETVIRKELVTITLNDMPI